VGKKTIGGGCSGRARPSGVLAGLVPTACTKSSDGVGEEVGDGVGDGDGTASREAAEAQREVASREPVAAPR
jgi:hypothetical protein